jgi:hypothetical protein
MALFNTAAILEDEPEEKTIELTCFRDSIKEIEPKLLINVDNNIRRISEKSLDRYNNLIGKRKQKNIEWQPINNPKAYCKDVLDVAYKDTIDLFDEPSKKAFYALFIKFPEFPLWLSSRIMKSMGGDAYHDEAEEDRKN